MRCDGEASLAAVQGRRKRSDCSGSILVRSGRRLNRPFGLIVHCYKLVVKITHYILYETTLSKY